MKYLRAITILTVMLVTTSQTSAKEGNPAFWLIMPFASAVSNCSMYGEEIRQGLKKSLATGRENTKGKIPDTVWSLLDAAMSKTENRTPSREVKESCDTVIDLYRNPQFPVYFRQTVVTQLVASPAIQCITEQPQRAGEVKNAWLRAYTRNGLELSERAIDETVENARRYGKNKQPESGPTQSECEELATRFFGQEFDVRYGEKEVYELFAEY